MGIEDFYDVFEAFSEMKKEMKRLLAFCCGTR